MPDPHYTKTRWLLLPLAALLLAGVGICLYLTRYHDIEMYGDRSATLSNCPQTQTTNCEVVNTSGYAELLGVPIATLGIPTYLLLLLLTVAAWRSPRLLAYIFGVGLLTVAYSAYLYYVSKVKIGYLCAWCFRLYCINAGVLLLSGLAAWRSPIALLRDALANLVRPSRERWRAAAAFAVLLVVAIGGERAYRAALARPAPAGAASAAGGSSTTAVPATPFRSTIPMAEFSQHAGKVEMKPFDLNGRLGRGKPVALIFWIPGLRTSEEELVSFARFLKEKAPQVDAFAVVGASPGERPEILWEPFCLLEVPPELPLLRDDGFNLFKQLGFTGFPNVALFDGKGVRVAAIQGLKQTGSPGTPSAEELILQVARGESPKTAPALLPYYPSSQLFGHCAPSFHLPDLFTGKDSAFTARSTNGKPTLLMFWSSTCKHCQKEIPQLVRFVQGHPGEFNVVSVALIRPDAPGGGFSHRKVTEAYVRTNELPWPVLDDSSGYAEDLYRVTSTPTTFLIAPSGEILGAWYHPHENLEATMPAVLGRLAQTRGQCAQPPAEQTMRAAFSVAAPDGSKLSIDSLAGQPSVLHFWATWCAPCQAELPSLLKFRDRLERKGGKVVLVSVEDSDAAGRVIRYGSKMQNSFQSFLAPVGGLADRLDLSYSVPRTYLIASGGEVLKTYRGAQPWAEPSFERSVMTMLQLPPQ